MQACGVLQNVIKWHKYGHGLSGGLLLPDNLVLFSKSIWAFHPLPCTPRPEFPHTPWALVTLKGPSPLISGLWLSYALSSLNPLGVNWCELVVPQPSWRQVTLALIWAAGSWSLDTFNQYIQKNVFLFEALLIGHLSSLQTDLSHANVSVGHTWNLYIPIDFTSPLELHGKTQLLLSSPLPSSYGLLAIHKLFLMPKNSESDPKLMLGLLLSPLKHQNHVQCICKHSNVN